MPKTIDLPDQLESLIDTHGLARVLAALRDVCHAKADHASSTWQAYDHARWFDNAAARIDVARGSKAVQQLAESFGQKGDL